MPFSRSLTFITVGMLVLSGPGFTAERSKGRVDVPERPAMLDTPLPLQKLHDAAASRHVLTRIDALRELASRGDRESRLVMKRSLKDAEPTVRRLAALGLARIADRGDAPAVSLILDDEEPLVRHAAGMALINMASAPTADAVLKKVRGLDCRPQSAVVGVDPTEASAAMRRWGQSPLVIAKKVLQAIAVQDEAARDTLKSAIGDRNRCVRYVAAYALGNLPQPGLAEVLEAGATRRDVAVIAGAYQRFLERDDRPVRTALLWGTVYFDDPDLIFALRNSGDAQLERVADWALTVKGIDIDGVTAQ